MHTRERTATCTDRVSRRPRSNADVVRIAIVEDDSLFRNAAKYHL